MHVDPTVQVLLTVPAFMIAAVSGVLGVLVFMLTTRSTGSVDEACPKQTEHNKQLTNAQKRIFLTSTSGLGKPCNITLLRGDILYILWPSERKANTFSPLLRSTHVAWLELKSGHTAHWNSL